MTRLKSFLAACSLGGALCGATPGAAAEPTALADLSLEDLFAQEVSSVAKRPQNVKESPAAVFVIGREDIRRSGATTLPDLLRMVPGVEVAALQWHGAAVTARGFNGQYANKLLVLVDGRSIYVSAVSGVPWDQQMVPVEDIERIEVVRGPGAALWGSNAVNGVINVITKHSIDSQAGAAGLEIDSEEAGRVHLRQGARVGETGVIRFSGQGRRDVQTIQQYGVRDRQIHRTGQIGLRYDVQPTQSDAVTLQGDVATGRHDTDGPLAGSLGADGSFEAGNALARWTRTNDETGGRTSVQGYFDYAQRSQQFIRRLWSVEFSNQFKAADIHDVVWGLGYRYIENRNLSQGVFSFADSDQSIYDGFIQDDISLMSNRLKVSIGTKLEHNPRTGLEVQPSLRAIWLDPAGWSVWAAVSRAVRTPSDYEADGALDMRPIAPVLLLEGAADAEVVLAYELGWRGRLNDKVTLDATAFYNRYNGLIGVRGGVELVDGAPAQVYRLANLTSAATYGVEASMTAEMTPAWRLQASASVFEADIDAIAGDFTSLGALSEAQSPDVQVSVRSMLDLSDALDLDIWARHVGALSGGAGEAYSDLDVRLAWRPTATSELFVAGENLLDRDRVEFAGGISIIPLPEAVVDRRVRVGLKLQY